jgi:L-threonylcarbamoyladenylate synthase
MERLTLDQLDDAALERIAKVIRSSGVVILPTETLYGFHCSTNDPVAIGKILAAKGRDEGKPLLSLCASERQIRSLGFCGSDDVLRRLLSIWPAPLTAILEIEQPLASTAGQSKAAVRISSDAWLRRLCEFAGPIASTSLNRSGEPTIDSTEGIPDELLENVAVMVDGGPRTGLPSTVVDATVFPPVVLREGAFRFRQNLWKTL